VSKAFTRESDDAIEAVLRRRGVPVPDGPNYLTASGARALRDEHDRLAHDVRDPDGEARLHELAEHLGSAEIVEHPPDDQVGFGSLVTVEDDDDGARHDYALVGAIEAAPREGRIHWQSPLARALLGAKVGDLVSLPRDRTGRVVAIRAT